MLEVVKNALSYINKVYLMCYPSQVRLVPCHASSIFVDTTFLISYPPTVCLGRLCFHRGPIEKGAQKISRRLIELAEIKPGQKVIDIATGIGTTLLKE